MIGLGQAPCELGIIRATVHRPGSPPSVNPWVLAATILGSSMSFLDASVVNVALPSIQTALGTSLRGAQWTVNSYMLMLGALMLVGGAAGDRFGRRRIFAMGIAIFTIASVACGLAPNISALITARLVQGVGGALLVPSSLAIIGATFPQAERGKAIGTWAGFSALTTALGPVLGGWLVDALSWRAIFFINVPIALMTLGIASRYVPESRDQDRDATVDWTGGALATGGLMSLTYGLSAASDAGWTDPIAIGALLSGALLFAVFIWFETRTRFPMVPLKLFRSRTFSGANAMTLLLYFALGGVVFFLPFELIRLHGYSATLAGAAFLPFTVIMGALSRWSGGLSDRYGARRPLIVGPMIAAAGFALFALPGVGGSYWTSFFPPMAVLGLGMAISVAPLTTTVMSAVEAQYAGTASGINNAVSKLAGMFAVVVMGALAVGVFATALDARLAELPISPDIASAIRAQAPQLAAASVPPQVRRDQRQMVDGALDDALVQSFRSVMLAAAGLALASALCAGLMIEPGTKAPSRPAAR